MKSFLFWMCLGILFSSKTTASAAPIIAGTPFDTMGTVIFSAYISETGSSMGIESVGPIAYPSIPGVSFETGFIVLLDSAGVPSTDNTNWSDVFYVMDSGPGQVFGLISEGGSGFPAEGIYDSQLSTIGTTVAAINGASNTLYVVEAPFTTAVPGIGIVSGIGAIVGPLIDPTGSGSSARYVFNSQSVPEPSGLVLFATGAVGLVGSAFRKLRRTHN